GCASLVTSWREAVLAKAQRRCVLICVRHYRCIWSLRHSSMLDSLPRTPNGKLDRRALPAPKVDAYSTKRYEAPRSEIEQRLAAIWAELLRIDRIGLHDDFFEMGGHSLLAMRAVILIRERTGIDRLLIQAEEKPEPKPWDLEDDELDNDRIEARWRPYTA